ncbi:MAG: 50S ribosomal protein L18e [Desulfurococcaceae archaeon]|nr:50S ribosomal protein L18e [Desulfurococcaceae archaeon]MCC6057909.1 50S ribosomal protein L18e [Desulfurococcaceae archaeon]
MRRTGPTNYVLRKTIRVLRSYANRYNAAIWRYLAELLEKPARKRIVVNISKINRYTDDGDIIVVPGKVLGAGNLDHKVTVAAIAFSQQAIQKIKAAGGNVMHILELLQINPKGGNIKVII